jgi:hypothetical protein
MHAAAILHRCLQRFLNHIHQRRLAALLNAVGSCVSGPRLSLTDVGRRFAGEADLRHKIKRADRLLGNRHLQHEAHSVYEAMCRVLLARISEPLIVVDWSDLKADQSLHLLRASLPVGGRSLTLYEEAHPQRKLCNRTVQEPFFADWRRCYRSMHRPSSSPMPASRCPSSVPSSDSDGVGWVACGGVIFCA